MGELLEAWEKIAAAKNSHKKNPAVKNVHSWEKNSGSKCPDGKNFKKTKFWTKDFEQKFLDPKFLKKNLKS